LGRCAGASETIDSLGSPKWNGQKIVKNKPKTVQNPVTFFKWVFTAPGASETIDSLGSPKWNGQKIVKNKLKIVQNPVTFFK
jgi:hypothetical protein